MNQQAIAFVIFALLGCMVFIWFALCKVLFNRLERAHPQKYEAMGRPSLVLRNNLANKWSFLKFLARREYVALNTLPLPSCARLCAYILLPVQCCLPYSCLLFYGCHPKLRPNLSFQRTRCTRR